ncbi:hypothetical protein JX265_002566 [Neoarthrinium moseri]|uniref:Nuclear GTPase SLIP-GC n=1 Tax=Neoarthrinium moseri TaxID=1658444 RepID=A0A9Q0ATM1_9PEZI|nr:hypothetical protein JX265_002566 [Neoarthrinium moseri]
MSQIPEKSGQPASQHAAPLEHHTKQQNSEADERVVVLRDSQNVLEPTTLDATARVKSEPMSPQREPRPTLEAIDDSRVEFPSLHRALDESKVETLENIFQVAQGVLDKLQKSLGKTTDNTDAKRILDLIEDLKTKAVASQTLVCLMGDTGGGKSTIINGLLGKKKVVPTSCMRACTACPTEISYNNTDGPDWAEVEFISVEEWLAELRYLFNDVLNGDGEVHSNSTNQETEAGVAWAKITTIYPHMTRDLLAQTTEKTLAKDRTLGEFLGTTKKVIPSKSDLLYKKVQRFIDSKEKISNKETSIATTAPGPSELWPLIKVVRLYVKADVLSTGLTLADLPGVGDSNAARASVASKYVEKCNGIWIVAPIVRAVDNKTAQHLLGESFKMQLKFDGNISNVSFICSQTDDIVVGEAVDSLNLAKEYAEHLALEERTAAENANRKTELDRITETQNEFEAEATQVQNDLNCWNKLALKNAKGIKVFAPVTKRKLQSQQSQVPKKRRFLRVFVESDDEDKQREESTANAQQEALTHEQITLKINQFESQLKDLSDRLEDLYSQEGCIEKAIGDAEGHRQRSKVSIMSSCIQRRNAYSSTAIQAHFALGVQKLDQETAIKKDDESFDPDHQERDYQQIAQSLPVFCVSSQAYQVKKGTAKIDRNFDAFHDLKMTGMPQLHVHAKKLTEAGRISDCRKFLNGFLQILQSLQILTGTQSLELVLSPNEQADEVKKLLRDLGGLKLTLDEAAKKSSEDCKHIFKKKLFKQIHKANDRAIDEAPRIVTGWVAPTEQGGYYHSTLKATLTRQGHFKRKAGTINLNEELITGLKRELATPWEDIFSRYTPEILKLFSQSCREALEEFHQQLKARLRHTGAASTIDILHTQLQTYNQGINDKLHDFEQRIQEWQRDLSRQFMPGVKRVMTSVYDDCAEEQGRGSFKRISKKLIGFANSDFRVFDKSIPSIQSKLSRICTIHKETLLEEINLMINNMTADYTNGIQKRGDAGLPQVVRREVMEVLSGVDREMDRGIPDETPNGQDVNMVDA